VHVVVLHVGGVVLEAVVAWRGEVADGGGRGPVGGARVHAVVAGHRAERVLGFGARLRAAQRVQQVGLRGHRVHLVNVAHALLFLEG